VFDKSENKKYLSIFCDLKVFPQNLFIEPSMLNTIFTLKFSDFNENTMYYMVKTKDVPTTKFTKLFLEQDQEDTNETDLVYYYINCITFMKKDYKMTEMVIFYI